MALIDGDTVTTRLCLFCFVCAYDSWYACGGTATAETTFLGRDPEYTRVTAEETRCRIATSPLVDHPGFGRPAHSLLGEVPLVTTPKSRFAGVIFENIRSAVAAASLRRRSRPSA